ncbi:MAG: Gfo/Idh/MocA family oxidoreductase [Pseudomonadota bacterium]
MPKPARVGMVGAGYFAGFQRAAWGRLEGAVLVGVAERDPARRAALDVAGHDGLDALLAAERLNILDIATPPETHADLIAQALGRVPLIICQKPFCADLATAQRMTAAARDAGTALVVHENFRFQPWYREIAALLSAGRLGDVRQARFALRPGDGAGPDAYLDRQPYFRAMERFLIRETGIHFVDTFRFLFGDPQAVYADLRRENPAIAGEDAGLVVFDLDGGGRAIFDGNRTLDHGAENRRLTMGELEIEGTGASVRLTGAGEIWIRDAGAVAAARHDFDFLDRDFGGDCVQAFQAHVLAGRATGRFETAAADYLANLRLEAAIYRSAAEGRKLGEGAL